MIYFWIISKVVQTQKDVYLCFFKLGPQILINLVELVINVLELLYSLHKFSIHMSGKISRLAFEIFSHLFQLLNSPWDICFEPLNEKIYIAMAGQHQIWEHNTFDGVTSAFSGDGYERNLNGSRYCLL